MKNKQAFTLIELLVVVLIIGILAAVALPQYQKAVEKSRAAQAQTMLKSVSQAIENYYLANGEWPQSFDELAIDIPWTGTDKYISNVVDVRSNGEWTIGFGKSSMGIWVMVGRMNGPYAGGGFMIHDEQHLSQYYPGETLCIEGKSGRVLIPFHKADGEYCAKLFGAQLAPTDDAVRYYRIN